MNVFFKFYSHTAKSKALTYFRDPAADVNTPVTKEGPVNVKVTLIDGKVRELMTHLWLFIWI